MAEVLEEDDERQDEAEKPELMDGEKPHNEEPETEFENQDETRPLEGDQYEPDDVIVYPVEEFEPYESEEDARETIYILREEEGSDQHENEYTETLHSLRLVEEPNPELNELGITQYRVREMPMGSDSIQPDTYESHSEPETEHQESGSTVPPQIVLPNQEGSSLPQTRVITYETHDQMLAHEEWLMHEIRHLQSELSRVVNERNSYQEEYDVQRTRTSTAIIAHSELRQELHRAFMILEKFRDDTEVDTFLLDLVERERVRDDERLAAFAGNLAADIIGRAPSMSQSRTRMSDYQYSPEMPPLEDMDTFFDARDEQIFAMDTGRDREYRTTMTPRDERRPIREFPCMTAYVQINGQTALALFDSGSSVDAINSSFAAVHHIKTFTLKIPVRIQMGCTGSRGMISSGTKVSLTLGPRTEDTYFDILNVDHYDVIIGVGLMSKIGIHLDFEHQQIHFGPTTIASLPSPELIRYRRTAPQSGTSSKYQWAHQKGDSSKE
ncbi:hypothetical protein EUX98_g9331 [Antrodiella citrinella]|uniref:Peptidase A2 domain-containing protein n=1 Tax=Antrodiella citrinella TaxID=2447956 RepID=A0A4S4LUR9_9APHY|nr:hypothetical protein EUX98_g9331 [Antrodiella citrinella]